MNPVDVDVSIYICISIYVYIYRASKSKHSHKSKCIFTYVCVLVTWSCLTLEPHGLWPARLLCPQNSPGIWTRLPFPSPGDLPNPGFRPQVSGITGRFFTVWATSIIRLNRKYWSLLIGLYSKLRQLIAKTLILFLLFLAFNVGWKNVQIEFCLNIFIYV